jgi:hypothetical protein
MSISSGFIKTSQKFLSFNSFLRLYLAFLVSAKTQDIASDCDPPASPVKRELRTRRQTGDSEICVNENSKSPRELRCSSINVKEGPKEIGVVRNLSKTAKAGSITERVKAEINSYILTSKLVVDLVNFDQRNLGREYFHRWSIALVIHVDFYTNYFHWEYLL